MKIENLITKRSRLDRRMKLTKQVNRWANRKTLAVATWGFIIGALFGCYIADNPNKSISRPFSQTIEVKPITVEAKEKDWSTDLVGYFRHRGQEIGYDDYTITKLHGVMDCENGLHTADRVNYLYDGEDGRYTAAGFAMITNRTWKGHKCEGNKFNGVDNINCFYKIIGDNQSLQDYNASRHCWGKKFDIRTIKFIKL